MRLLFRLLRFIGAASRDALAVIGALTIMIGQVATRVLRRPIRPRTFFAQILQIGIRSLSLGLTMSIFAGMVLAFQFGYGLERFGAKLYIGQTTVTALCRELGPILTALVVGGRIGAGIAAELGGMAVTQQLDAVRALGADPVQRLVAPRVVATMIALPLLAVCADVIGTLGGLVIADLQYDVSPQLYLRGVVEFVTIWDFSSGILKSLVFGLIIGALACYEGMRAEGGTEGVGRATTRAVVASALSVLAADLVLTKLFLTGS